jgi:hypothetical protein
MFYLLSHINSFNIQLLFVWLLINRGYIKPDMGAVMKKTKLLIDIESVDNKRMIGDRQQVEQ